MCGREKSNICTHTHIDTFIHTYIYGERGGRLSYIKRDFREMVPVIVEAGKSTLCRAGWRQPGDPGKSGFCTKSKWKREAPPPLPLASFYFCLKLSPSHIMEGNLLDSNIDLKCLSHLRNTFTAISRLVFYLVTGYPGPAEVTHKINPHTASSLNFS